MEKAIKVLEARAKEYKKIGSELAYEYENSCNRAIMALNWLVKHNPDYQPEKVEHYEGDEIINQLF